MAPPKAKVRVRNGGDYCSAPNCKNARNKIECKGWSFFRFPLDQARCDVWKQNCGHADLMTKTADNLNTGGYALCRIHFEDNQFKRPDKKDRLVFNAVPTIFDVPNPPRLLKSTRPSPKKRCSSQADHLRKKRSMSGTQNDAKGEAVQVNMAGTSELADEGLQSDLKRISNVECIGYTDMPTLDMTCEEVEGSALDDEESSSSSSNNVESDEGRDLEDEESNSSSDGMRSDEGGVHVFTSCDTKVEKSCRQSIARHRPSNPDSKRQQKKVSCPVEGCRGEVINLRRHLSQLHYDIPSQECSAFLLSLKINKRSETKGKRKLKSWRCPQDGCSWEGDRLDIHLSSKAHSLDKHLAKIMAKEAKKQQDQVLTYERYTKGTRKCSSASKVVGEFYEWYSI